MVGLEAYLGSVNKERELQRRFAGGCAMMRNRLGGFTWCRLEYQSVGYGGLIHRAFVTICASDICVHMTMRIKGLPFISHRVITSSFMWNEMLEVSLHVTLHN